MMRVSLYILVLLILCSNTKAQEQVHPQSAKYEWPTDLAVKEKLDTWRDQKFGMIIHWGLNRGLCALKTGYRAIPIATMPISKIGIGA